MREIKYGECVHGENMASCSECNGDNKKHKESLRKFAYGMAYVGLMLEVEKWCKKYELNFQFWHTHYAIFIGKDGIDLYSTNGEDIQDVILKALEYIYRVNRTPKKDRYKHLIE